MANQIAIFKGMDEEMVRLFHEGTSESLEKSEEIAKILISYAELPLGLRCRACITLAAFDQPGYVGWAREAVRVADLAMQEKTNPTEAEKALHQRAHECLKQALEYFEEHGEGTVEGEDDGEEDGGEDEDGEEDDEVQEDRGELVFDESKWVDTEGNVHVVDHMAAARAKQEESK